ncbi:MAG: uracil phosphoribosyltransferase [Oscillospiraceae bacterium]|nr:uracil phosphoribosyltransferase [Oscillospiraceae bacterium]
MQNRSNLKILEHPLLQHKISLLRDKNTHSKEFRELVSEISMLMTYEATRDLPLKEVQVETPIAIAKTKVVSKKLALVPILRAGLGMSDGAITLIPAAKVGHIGLCRDGKGNVTEYYCKLPVDIAERDVIVTDLLLATGNSASAAISKLKESGCKSIKFMCAVACPEGLKALNDSHPDVTVFCGVMDDGLTDDLYITPGLGDGGDRIFGTK